jgi:hypothetical protein
MPVDRMLHPRVLDSQKVAEISHLDYRAWSTYVLVADDFGVMPMEPSEIRKMRVFKKEKERVLVAALEKMFTIGLVRRFEHQGQFYIWSPNWQHHQKIRYPRREETHYPPPPEVELAALDHDETASTRELFATFHLRVSSGFSQQFGDHEVMAKLGARKGRRGGGGGGPDSGNGPGMFSERRGNVAEVLPEHSVPRTYAHDAGPGNGLRLTANGQRLTAGDGLEGAEPLDVWFRELAARYPRQAVTTGHLTENHFFDQIARDGRLPRIVFDEMLDNLANQMAGHQWRVKRMVPKLANWLRDGVWRQRHDATPPTDLVSEKTLATTNAADAFVSGGGRGAR